MSINPFKKRDEYQEELAKWRAEVGKLKAAGKMAEARALEMSPPQPEWYRNAEKPNG
jgi:hypothetical protein